MIHSTKQLIIVDILKQLTNKHYYRASYIHTYYKETDKNTYYQVTDNKTQSSCHDIPCMQSVELKIKN